MAEITDQLQNRANNYKSKMIDCQMCVLHSEETSPISTRFCTGVSDSFASAQLSVIKIIRVAPPRLLRRNIFRAFLKSPSAAGSPPRSGLYQIRLIAHRIWLYNRNLPHSPTPLLSYSPTLNYIISIQPDLILGVGTLADFTPC
ncbi:MAG: hypothetical protein SWX82_32355 [Cyanobacteriota bacterium]|nr:hypothetical protein [Cyanobacteriota bacterium]